MLGTGGVGSAVAAVAHRRTFVSHLTLADLDPARPRAVVDRLGEPDRFAAMRVDASRVDDVRDAIRSTRADAVLNACDPRLNPPILSACLETRTTYLDLAMTLSGGGTML